MMRTFDALGAGERAAAARRIADICLASSDAGGRLEGAARDEFFGLWAGGYLDRWPGLALVHGRNCESIDGYLVGCEDSAAAEQLYDAIFYYRAFAAHYRTYPAHFHVNVAAEARNRGTGTALVEAFAGLCRARACPGMHLVTAADARNRAFYDRAGFTEVERKRVGGHALVLLGRKLDQD